MESPAFVAAAPRLPTSTRTGPPAISSSFTPGTGRLTGAGASEAGGVGMPPAPSPSSPSPSAAGRSPRMAVAVATRSKVRPPRTTAAAAAALRKADVVNPGTRKADVVDPGTQHEAATPSNVRRPVRRAEKAGTRWVRPSRRAARRPTPLPEAAPAADAAAVPVVATTTSTAATVTPADVGTPAAKAWAAGRSVVGATAAGGGWVGGEVVAADAAAKRAAWAAEMAALRADGAVAPVPAPRVPSRPSVAAMAVRAIPTTSYAARATPTTSYAARVGRLGDHAAGRGGVATATAPAPAGGATSHTTSVGGGWGASAAVAADAAAKRAAWDAEMAALRSPPAPVGGRRSGVAPPRATRAVATRAPVYTPAPISTAQSVTVVGAPRVATPAYEARVERLAAHSSAVAAAAAEAAAAPPVAVVAAPAPAEGDGKRRSWFQMLAAKAASVAPPAAPVEATPVAAPPGPSRGPLLAPELSAAGGREGVPPPAMTGGQLVVPRPQRLVAAAMAVSLSVSKGLPKGSKRAAAMAWLLMRH